MSKRAHVVNASSAGDGFDPARPLADGCEQLPPFSPECVGERHAPDEPFHCPSCGAGYPVVGVCHGFGEEKHKAAEVLPR
jgi:hypothetical protein